MKNIFNFLKIDEIGNPPWDYYFLKNLDEKEYPKYLAKLFYLNTGEKLPLKFDFKNKSLIIDKKRCKTFNQKIQWIKLYGVTDLMRRCTDKVLVRDYAAEKIGSEYLKPVLQVIPKDKEINCGHICPPCGESTCDNRGKGVSNNSLRVTKGGINEVVYDNEVTHLPPTPSDTNKPPFVLRTFSPQGGQMSEDSCRDVTTYFDQIDFDKLPNSFVIKCNHGCKWQYIIKDKEEFLKNKRLFDIVKRNITGWLEQDYSFWGGFEMQYKVKSADRHCEQVDFNLEPAWQSTTKKYNPMDCHVTQNAVVPRNDKYIEPKILIEPLLRNDINKNVEQIQVYCFWGIPKLILRLNEGTNKQTTLYDEKLNIIDDILSNGDIKANSPADELLNQSIVLSKEISKDFLFVRADWMIYNNKLYFEELTFTPYSGFHRHLNCRYNIKLGKLLIWERKMK